MGLTGHQGGSMSDIVAARPTQGRKSKTVGPVWIEPTTRG
jgi:hypothetical protein